MLNYVSFLVLFMKFWVIFIMNLIVGKGFCGGYLDFKFGFRNCVGDRECDVLILKWRLLE